MCSPKAPPLFLKPSLRKELKDVCSGKKKYIFYDEIQNDDCNSHIDVSKFQLPVISLIPRVPVQKMRNEKPQSHCRAVGHQRMI